jgi:hypothetical protein
MAARGDLEDGTPQTHGLNAGRARDDKNDSGGADQRERFVLDEVRMPDRGWGEAVGLARRMELDSNSAVRVFASVLLHHLEGVDVCLGPITGRQVI